MSGKLKFLLIVLGVGAGLSFWYVQAWFSGGEGNSLSAAISNQAAADEACHDTDSDGLCDYDETYWNTDFKDPDTDDDGFSDGEEVLSGHNPAKAGPDDMLNNSENLTQKASRLLLGAMVTGDLSKDSATSQQTIDRLVDLIFQQYDDNTATELDSILIASASSTALIQYGTAMTRILNAMIPEIQSNQQSFLETIRGVDINNLSQLNKLDPDVYAKFANAADNEVTAFNERVATVKSMRVPPKLISFHRSLLQYLRGTQQQYRLARGIVKDPVQGLLSLQMLNVLTTETIGTLTDSFTYQVTSALP